MKSSREQFEEWYTENWGHTEDHHETLFERDPDCPEDYYRFGVRLAYHSWQASRAAIEITLPDCDDYQSTWQYQDAAEDKIKAHGLTVK